MLEYWGKTVRCCIIVGLLVFYHGRALALQSSDNYPSLAAPVSLVEEQWGSKYFPMQCRVTDDESLECLFKKSGTTHIPGSGGEGAAFSPTGCLYTAKTVDMSVCVITHTVRGVATPELCQMTCQNQEECAFAVFREVEQTCEHMKGSLKPLDLEGETLVLPTCDGSCLVSGETYTGKGALLGRTPDALLCQLVCKQSTGCSYFTWDSRKGECFSYGDREVPSFASSSVVRGPARTCSVQERSFDYAGSCEEVGVTAAVERNFLVFTTESKEACHDACRKNNRCNWATFNTQTELCFLKDSRGSHSVVSKADITFPKLCDSSCFRKDSRLLGHVLAKTYEAKNPHYCHYECWMRSQCRYWNWFPNDESCALFEVEAGAESTFSPGDWSGRRGGCGEEQEIVA